MNWRSVDRSRRPTGSFSYRSDAVSSVSFVHDLRATLVFALAGVVTLGIGLRLWNAGEPPDAWLTQVAIGSLLCLLVADDAQRRWRGDPRVREAGPDARGVAATTLGFVGLALVGLWALASGYDAWTWIVLLGGGLTGAAFCGWTLRDLRQ